MWTGLRFTYVEDALFGDLNKIYINTLIGDVILGVDNGRYFETFIRIGAYPYNEFQNLQIEVIPPGVEKRYHL